MKFYVDKMPKHYWECPFLKDDLIMGKYCTVAKTNCSRFYPNGILKEDAAPKECLCLKVLPQGSTISGLEEGNP